VILDNGPGDRVQCSQTNSSFLVSNIQNYLYCFITKNRLETDPSITGDLAPSVLRFIEDQCTGIFV
jgi:hypothetical protein